MGWSISHGIRNTRSATTIQNLAQHLAHVLPASEWRVVEPVFGTRSADPFRVPHNDARRIAAVLRRAASHRKMPSDWGDLARELAVLITSVVSSRQA